MDVRQSGGIHQNPMSISKKELEDVAALMRKQFEESQSPEAKAEIENRIHEREEEIYRKVTELAEKTVKQSEILTDISNKGIQYELVVEIVAAGIIAATNEYGIKI